MKSKTTLVDKKSKASAEGPVYNNADKKLFSLARGASFKKAQEYCEQSLLKMPNPLKSADALELCKVIKLEQSCMSKQGTPIFHYDRKGHSSRGKRILTISLIHGDEHASGSVTASWMKRLNNLNPRNSWRIIPVVNPDGWAKNTRMNAAGVDINRNFPSKDWEKLALDWWKTKKKSDPRRYPGPRAASEVETNCLIKHIDDFQPDFIIAIHTPLGLLDFDGPSLTVPSSIPLPWQRLGNFPGSLGRYMWIDHKVPVLTIELKGSQGIAQLEQFDKLQDISGTVAIQASRILKKSKSKN